MKNCLARTWSNLTVRRSPKLRKPKDGTLQILNHESGIAIKVLIQKRSFTVSPYQNIKFMRFSTKNCVQVNLCQKLLFLHQLTHNITRDCSLNYKFNT